jgi:hypothetical protein
MGKAVVVEEEGTDLETKAMGEEKDHAVLIKNSKARRPETVKEFIVVALARCSYPTLLDLMVLYLYSKCFCGRQVKITSAEIGEPSTSMIVL